MSGTEIAVCVPYNSLRGIPIFCVNVSQYIIVQSIINGAQSITVQSLVSMYDLNICFKITPVQDMAEMGPAQSRIHYPCWSVCRVSDQIVFN